MSLEDLPVAGAAFRLLPTRHLVLTRALVPIAVTDAYAESVGLDRAELLGRPLLGSLARAQPALDIEALESSFQRVLDSGATHRVAVAGTWTAVTTPVLRAAGEVGALVHALEESWTSERRARELLDAAPDAMVVVDVQSVIRLVNAQAESLFGYRREELVGAPLDLLLPERLRAAHAGHVARYAGKPRSRPMGVGLELLARRKDGTELDVEVSISPLGADGELTMSAAIRDISQRKRLERAAALNAERLRSACENIDDGIALFDREGRLVLCSAAYQALVAGSPDENVVGESYETLLDRWIARNMQLGDAAATAAYRQERLRRWSEHATYELRTRDGRKLRVRNRPTPEGGVVKTVWDLTEDERRTDELQHARVEAERASAAKTEFLASMSHELRTPMNAVLGFAQLLLRDRKLPLDERHARRANQILRAGEHLLRLIDDILDLARIESGGVAISLEPVDVGGLLPEVVTTLEPLAARHRVAVVARHVPEGFLVQADRTRLAQVLLNLGTNAVKYNHPEGTVSFHVGHVGDRVRITVEDSGIGVPRAMHEKIFQPFQRAGQEMGPIEGTGIGLVITKRLVELMGGAVGFASDEGVGSRFWVDLSLAERSAIPRHHDLGPRHLHGEENASRIVLYVEDNPANVSFMADLMGTLGDVVLVTAPTAELGIELARVRRPSLVILDINLPGMSGLDAVRALRSMPETRALPVIALTAAASAGDRKRGLAAGFDRYLTKPVRVDELERAMNELLSSEPRTAAP